MMSDFVARLTQVLPRLLAAGALPDDWDPRATTYDLFRFDSDTEFGARLDAALDDIARLDQPAQICRISVPEYADVDGVLAAMDGFFAKKY